MVGFQPLEYGATLSQFKNIHKPENFIIPVGLLSVFDIIKIFCKYIFTAKIYLKNEYSFKELNISNLINNSLKKDYFKLDQCMNRALKNGRKRDNLWRTWKRHLKISEVNVEEANEAVKVIRCR